jgi:hypothetical protein
MAEIETKEVFTASMNDVEETVREKSNLHLLGIVEQVKEEYENDPSVSLTALTEKYGIKEINVVSSDGIITDSTPTANRNFTRP